MKKETLKDWFKFQVWRQSGGTLPELCDLSEIREWLNETADDPDLDARISAVQTTTTGLLDRAAALEAIVQTAVDGAPDAPVAATLATGALDSELLWTAKTAGKIGEAISVKFEIPATELTITPAVGGNASAIKYTGVKGQRPISVTYVMTGTNTFSIAAVGNAVTITMASDTGTCLTTAAELFAALETAIGTGGELDGIISAVEKAVPAEWANATLMEANVEDFLDSALSVATDGNAITVSLAYDGATDAITSTANDIITAIVADDPGANDLVTVVATGAGTALAKVVEEANLDNGADGTVGAAGALRFDSSKLYVSVDESKEGEDNWLSAPLLPTLPTVIDLSDASDDYVIEDEKNSIVVLTDNASTANDIILPAAIVGLRVTIINQDDASVSISPASGEYINGTVDNPFNLTTLNSATFYCYADGYWAII